MNIQERADHLFQKYLDGSCTPEEWEELQVLIAGIPEGDAETLTEPLRQLWTKARHQELPSTVHLLDKEKMYAAITQGGQVPYPVARGGRVRRMNRWVVAAAVVAALLLTVTWYLQRQPSPEMAQASLSSPAKVRPGIDKAVLTLANGKQIVLDSNTSGNIGRQGNATVMNAGGQLAYLPEGHADAQAAVPFNNVSTGRANQYRLVLPDGSKVWLNAVSSIRFPAIFNGAERTVAITGEAYFEITPDAAHPFHVKVGATNITVLGTAFNINAYEDEPVLKTSLLSGSVKVSSGGKSSVLTPGEEANITREGVPQIIAGDVDMAVAWKNGYFQFDKAPLPQVMRQIGRWYDLDIKYEGSVSDRLFRGKLQRNLPLSGMVRLLQAEDVHVRLDGKVLTVMP